MMSGLPSPPLQRTRPSCSGCIRAPLWAGSPSLVKPASDAPGLSMHSGPGWSTRCRGKFYIGDECLDWDFCN